MISLKLIGEHQLITSLPFMIKGIMNAVSNKNHQIDVYIDSGVRRETDILNAVAVDPNRFVLTWFNLEENRIL